MYFEVSLRNLQFVVFYFSLYWYIYIYIYKCSVIIACRDWFDLFWSKFF